MANFSRPKRSHTDLCASESGDSAIGKQANLQSQKLHENNSVQNRVIDIKAKGFEFGSIQASLLSGLDYCFYVKSSITDAYVFAASSQEERNFWLTRYACTSANFTVDSLVGKLSK